MKQNKLRVASLFLVGLATLSACEEEKVTPLGAFKNAAFIVCEGNFGSNDASIYAIKNDTLQEEIFASINSRPLGDIAQSMTIIGDKAYIVVNNSGKIEVVNVNTFKNEGTAKGFSFPRYVAERNDNEIFVSTGNVSDNSYVYVVNCSSLEKTDSVKAGTGPNAMVVSNGKLFVANMGGWTNDSTVTVIDINSLSVLETVTVGDVPADLEIDAQGNVLVLCKGLTKYNYDLEGTYVGEEIVSNSSIVKLDASSYAVSTIKSFDHQIALFAENLMAYNNGTIYYLDGGAYRISENGGSETKLMEDVNAYGISFDSEENKFWVVSTPFSTTHTATLYNNDGTLVKSYNVGNFPKMVVFNK